MFCDVTKWTARVVLKESLCQSAKMPGYLDRVSSLEKSSKGTEAQCEVERKTLSLDSTELESRDERFSSSLKQV